MIFSIPETQKAIQDIEKAYKNILKGKPLETLMSEIYIFFNLEKSINKVYIQYLEFIGWY